MPPHRSENQHGRSQYQLARTAVPRSWTIGTKKRYAPAVSNWKGIPTTNPLRTLVDIAGEVAPSVFDDALDRGIAMKLVTAEGVAAEAGRLSRQGRSGPAQLQTALVRRGHVDAPHPSVLESKLLRLFASHGLRVLATEVVVEDGRYRIDTQVGPKVFVEVDGYAYHASPEQKDRDDTRRNALRLKGLTVLVYGWRAVVDRGLQVVNEVMAALEQERLALAPRAGGRHRPLD